MPEFLRSVVVQDETPAADGEVPYDLPVNSISHLNLTLKCLNTAAAKATLAQILAAFEKIEILHRGQAIHSYSGYDLFVLNTLLLGHEPVLANHVDEINATRSIGLIIPMGRRLYDPAECFPPTRRGDLKINLKVDIANASYTGLILQIESVELLEAAPTRFLKVTTLTQTPTSGGENDLPLPIGNPFSGVLLYSTTVPDGVAWTATIEWLKLLANNRERYYSKANWESLHGDLIIRCGAGIDWSEKIHEGTAAEEVVDADLENYALLDFDPAKNDAYLFDTAGLAELKIRYYAGDANPVRALPMELVTVG